MSKAQQYEVWIGTPFYGAFEKVVLASDYEQLRAELAALKAGQGEAVAPYGYLREVDGNVQLSVGPARPADRSGGCATPWAAIFAAPPASAYAVSVPMEFVRFLLGEADLNGYSFGDMHQVRVGKFWWRTELRALIAQSQGAKP